MDQPPYARIVAEIRDRIASGELGPGDRVPSARQISRERGVAIATATKVLAALRQEGLVRAVPGVGTVVVEAPRGIGVTRESVVRAAIGLADAEGLETLSMRRVAAELGVATMTLYRHVRGKDDLVLQMADVAFGDVGMPTGLDEDWRTQLEAWSRVQWELFREHPWLPGALSIIQPRATPNQMELSEWAMRALGGLRLDRSAKLYVYVTLFNHVRGTALNLRQQAQLKQDTGMTTDEWVAVHGDPEFAALADPRRYPHFARVIAQGNWEFDLDALFEFGLGQLLDGLAARLA